MMLEIDRVGDDICGLCSADPGPTGVEIDATGESVEKAAGELGSEMVRHPTADGVAMAY